MSIRFFFIPFFMVLFLNASLAQPQRQLYSESKKAIKYFNDAITFYRAGKIDNASDYLNKAIEKDSNFIDAYLVLADIAKDNFNDAAALDFYLKVISINSDYHPQVLFKAAIAEMNIMQFKKASAHFRQYLTSPKFDKSQTKLVNKYIDQCDFAAKLMENPVDFNPKNLGEAINSDHDEYANAISTDDNMLIFTVKHPIQNSKREVEDFFYSNRDESENWKTREMMSSLFNTQYDEGAMVISPDGKMIIFASNRPGGIGRFDLYYSVKNGNKWTEPMNMGKNVNTEYWESQPSISSDGRTVFFVSDRKGGVGGSDIYFVTLMEDKTFGLPYNIGAPVNTEGNEMTPFIHHDAKTLYFVSNGHLGMGGTDIFVARKDKKGIFNSVQNIGYPVNTIGNELGLVVDAKGNLAYFSSDYSKGLGGFDIYAFELAENVKPIPVTYLKGIAYDKITKQKLEVDFELIDLQTGEIWIKSLSDKTTGEFLVCIPSGKELGLNAYKNDYLFYSDYFNVGELTSIDKPFFKDVPMTPISKGERIILKNILFATNSFDLRQESFVELNKLKQYLILNPTLVIEISGHTDNIGDATKNQILSENRSKSVYNFLIENGIKAERLIYKGYGQTQPTTSNETEEGRQENRRTEIRILSF